MVFGECGVVAAGALMDGEIVDLLQLLTVVRCLDRLRLGVDGEDREQRGTTVGPKRSDAELSALITRVVPGKR